MKGTAHDLLEVRAKAAEMRLSDQQLRIVELALQHNPVSRIAEILGTTQAVIYTQISRIRAKARALEQRKSFQRLAEETKLHFASQKAQIIFMHQKGCSTKLISQLLGLKYQKVADTIRRAKGRYWIIEVPPPDPERVASPVQEKNPLFRSAVSLYYHSFVVGDVDPQSREGRYRLLCAASGGAGGWPAKKVLLSERARLTKEWAERSRALRSGNAREYLRTGRIPRPTWEMLRIPKDADGDRQLSTAARSVLEDCFVRVSSESWRPTSPSSWNRLLQAVAIGGERP